MNPRFSARNHPVPTLACLALLAAPLLQAADFPTAPPGVVMERDLAYLAPQRAEKLDLYQPANREPGTRSPAVVIIHGGGWTGGDKGANREFITGTTLAENGYVCVSINYWLKEKDRWPTNLHDCKNAVRWLRVHADRLQIDPARIGVIGGSAGGHLALMVAYTGDDPRFSPAAPYPGISDRVSACVDMYGITNLLTRKQTKADGTPLEQPKGHALFPETRDQDPEKWRSASPVTHVTPKVPPTLILHGTADTTVDRDQSIELEKALRAAGVEVTLRMIEGATHAWPLHTKDFDLRGEVTAFFNRHLAPRRRSP